MSVGIGMDALAGDIEMLDPLPVIMRYHDGKNFFSLD